MKIGSIVFHCHDFDRTVAFWQAALHYVPRESAKDGWVVLRDMTQRTKVPICHFRVAIGVHAAGVGFISTSTPPTRKPKSSDWSLWERGDIPGGIVLETTSLCLRTRGVSSSASCSRPTCRAIRAEADTPGPLASMSSNAFCLGQIRGTEPTVNQAGATGEVRLDGESGPARPSVSPCRLSTGGCDRISLRRASLTRKIAQTENPENVGTTSHTKGGSHEIIAPSPRRRRRPRDRRAGFDPIRIRPIG